MFLKGTFASPLLKHRREGGEKKRQLHRQLQSFLGYTQTQLAAMRQAIGKIPVKMNKQIRRNPSQSNKTYLVCL